MKNPKFIVGLSPRDPQDTDEEFENLCKEFGSCIDYWYISPPLDKKYQSRNLNYEEKDLLKRFEILRKYDQRIQLALNTRMLSQEDAVSGIQFFINHFGKPESIVTLADLIPALLIYNIPITYSYNNTSFKDEIIEKCEAAVLGGRYIRDLKLMKHLKSLNTKIELLVNNGCHFYCDKDCGMSCGTLQSKRIQKIGRENALAEQSLLPEELNFYPEGLIDYYKISSRPSSVSYLRQCLNDYSKRVASRDLREKSNWAFYNRLGPMLGSFKRDEIIDVPKILRIKKQLWEKAYES